MLQLVADGFSASICISDSELSGSASEHTSSDQLIAVIVALLSAKCATVITSIIRTRIRNFATEPSPVASAAMLPRNRPVCWAALEFARNRRCRARPNGTVFAYQFSLQPNETLNRRCMPTARLGQRPTIGAPVRSSASAGRSKRSFRLAPWRAGRPGSRR